jgi:hypothetical protein
MSKPQLIRITVQEYAELKRAKREGERTQAILGVLLQAMQTALRVREWGHAAHALPGETHNGQI